MKVLVLYDYPPSPGGLATQGDLFYKGLLSLGVEAKAVHYKSNQEKEWYYKWFKPDVAVGVGFWGYTPDLVLHPQQFKILPIPWLVADGYIANYQHVLNKLPLILVTSQWVKEMYIRDGIKADNIEVLPVGCDTDSFIPFERKDPKIVAVRESFGISPEQIMILTVGGDAASKGALEIMQALASPDLKTLDWKYVCKVWPQPRTKVQNRLDFEMAKSLGLDHKVKYATNTISRNFMPYLMGACDIYAAPSRLEGFGMLQVEAGACAKPVIGIKAMGMLDTLVQNKTAFLAKVASKITVDEVIVKDNYCKNGERKIKFDFPRIVDYRADIPDLIKYLMLLVKDEKLRRIMGQAGRERTVQNFNYKVVAQKFLDMMDSKLGIN